MWLRLGHTFQKPYPKLWHSPDLHVFYKSVSSIVKKLHKEHEILLNIVEYDHLSINEFGENLHDKINLDTKIIWSNIRPS